MNIKCPCCGSQFSVEVALQEEAGRELLAEIARMSAPMSRALFAYLGLFRPGQRALSWSRALKLAREVVALGPESVLQPALEDTLVALSDKRMQPGWKPLSNHNYLKRVFESVEGKQMVTAVLPSQPTGDNPASRPTRKTSIRDDLSDTSWAE